MAHRLTHPGGGWWTKHTGVPKGLPSADRYPSRATTSSGARVVAGVFRDTRKLCPVCDEEYLSQDSVRLPVLPGDEGLTKEYCTVCAPNTEMVRAYMPKCWCGMTIRPRDKNCRYHGHRVCQCDSIFCPLWHDYSEKFVEKIVS